MTIGDTIYVRAFELDGAPRRWWQTTVESVSANGLCTQSFAGNQVSGAKGGWISEVKIRAHYWFDRPYNLLEVYNPENGGWVEIYVHIASPAQIVGGELHYTDYELDVVRYPGTEPFVADEDEFLEAVEQYDLSAQFQQVCYEAVETVMHLIRHWVPAAAPVPLNMK